MKHLVLLGDSIFDNGVYVNPGEPDVIKQVVAKLPRGWRATLRAVDGAMAHDVGDEMAFLPVDATHLIVSAGGNNALDEAKILLEPATTMAGAIDRLAGIGAKFQSAYHDMLQGVLQRGLPTMVCTIYEGNAPNPFQQRLRATALKIFNDIIIREAIAAQASVLDLRMICTQPKDYANPIEPSAIGGDKIAAAIVRAVSSDGFKSGGSKVYF